MTDIVAHEPAQRATYKIYFPLFDDVESLSNEVRLTHQGLRQHPQVQLVDRPESADYLVFCQNHLVAHNPHHARFVAIKDRFKDKTVMLDYGDTLYPGRARDRIPMQALAAVGRLLPAAHR